MVNKDIVLTKYIPKEKLDEFNILDLSEYDPNKPTILLADDYESIILLLKRLVSRLKLELNFNVVYASKQDSIYKIIKTLYLIDEFKIDIAITDITYGGAFHIGEANYYFDGIDLIEILLELNPALIYKFITGHRVDMRSTPDFYNKFKTYNEKEVLDKFIEFKDKQLSTNKDLILNMLIGTKYESLI